MAEFQVQKVDETSVSYQLPAIRFCANKMIIQGKFQGVGELRRQHELFGSNVARRRGTTFLKRKINLHKQMSRVEGHTASKA